MLPTDIRDLILDYWWGHKMYVLKKQLLRELSKSRFFNQVFSFYELYHHIQIRLYPDEENQLAVVSHNESTTD